MKSSKNNYDIFTFTDTKGNISNSSLFTKIYAFFVVSFNFYLVKDICFYSLVTCEF